MRPAGAVRTEGEKASDDSTQRTQRIIDAIRRYRDILRAEMIECEQQIVDNRAPFDAIGYWVKPKVNDDFIGSE